MSTRKAKRLAAAEAARSKPSGRTHLLGVLAGGAVITVFGAEIARVWRLGTLPRSRQITSEEERRAKPIEAVMTLREGYAVSRTRENSLFNMLASFTVAFGITRGDHVDDPRARRHRPDQGRHGRRPPHPPLPARRHPRLAAGGVAIGTKGEKLDKYLAFPFGVGVALVLDESALLLELDDVYWTEEGVLSVQIAFAAIAMLSALAYLIRMLRPAAKPGLRDRLGARGQGLGRPADELRRRARHRHLRTLTGSGRSEPVVRHPRATRSRTTSSAAAGAPLTKPKNGPKSWVAAKPGRYRPSRLVPIASSSTGKPSRVATTGRYGTRLSAAT